MTARAPAVSVLMAVHNGERHLRPAVESVLAQTFVDFELVVVDDGSKDSTRAILGSYEDPRIRIFANDENVGLTRSLNRGLGEARGGYVARQDADDISAPERLALQVAYLDRHPEIALLASAYRRIDDAGRHSGDRPVPLGATAIRWRLLFLNAFAHSSVMVRRAVVVALGSYDETIDYGEDYDLWSRIAERHEVAALSQRLVAYRRSATSMTSAQNKRGGDEISAISRRNVDVVLPGLGRRLDREAACRLLFGIGRPVGTKRAAATTVDVLRLQRAFARHHALTRREALAHRASVLVALARAVRRAGRRSPRVPAHR
jgi:glycosyltransferase involved in cell wall biosynthesis